MILKWPDVLITMFFHPGGKGVCEEDPQKAVQVSWGEVILLVEYFKICKYASNIILSVIMLYQLLK